MATVTDLDCLHAAALQLVQTYLNPSNSCRSNAALGPFRDVLTLATLQSALKNAALSEEFLGNKPDPLQSLIAPIITEALNIYGPDFLASHDLSIDEDPHAKALPKATIDYIPSAHITSGSMKISTAAPSLKSASQDVVESLAQKPSKRGITTSIIETRTQYKARMARETEGEAHIDIDDQSIVEAPPVEEAAIELPLPPSPEGKAGEDEDDLFEALNIAGRSPLKPPPLNPYSTIDKEGMTIRLVNLTTDYDPLYSRHFTSFASSYLEQINWAPYFSCSLTPDGDFPPRSNRKDRELAAAQAYYCSKVVYIEENPHLPREAKQIASHGIIKEQESAVAEIMDRFTKQSHAAAAAPMVTLTTDAEPITSFAGKKLSDLKTSQLRVVENIYAHMKFHLTDEQMMHVRKFNNQLAFADIYYHLVRLAITQLRDFRLSLEGYLWNGFHIGKNTDILAHFYTAEMFMTLIYFASNRKLKLDNWEMTQILRNSIQHDYRFKVVYDYHCLICRSAGDPLSDYAEFRKMIFEKELVRKTKLLRNQGKFNNTSQVKDPSSTSRQRTKDDRHKGNSSPGRYVQQNRSDGYKSPQAHYVQQDDRSHRPNDGRPQGNSHPTNPPGILKKEGSRQDDRRTPPNGNNNNRSQSPRSNQGRGNDRGGGRGRNGGRYGRNNDNYRRDQSQESKAVNFGRPGTPPPRRDPSTADGAERAQQGFKNALDNSNRQSGHSSQQKEDGKLSGGGNKHNPRAFHHLTRKSDDTVNDDSSDEEKDGWGSRKGPMRNFAFMVRKLSAEHSSGEEDEDEDDDDDPGTPPNLAIGDLPDRDEYDYDEVAGNDQAGPAIPPTDSPFHFDYGSVPSPNLNDIYPTSEQTLRESIESTTVCETGKRRVTRSRELLDETSIPSPLNDSAGALHTRLAKRRSPFIEEVDVSHGVAEEQYEGIASTADLPPLESTIDGSMNCEPVFSRFPPDATYEDAGNESGYSSRRSPPMILHESEPEDPFSDIDEEFELNSPQAPAPAGNHSIEAQELIAQRFTTQVEEDPRDDAEQDDSIPTSELVLMEINADPAYATDMSLRYGNIRWVYNESFSGAYGQPIPPQMMDLEWINAVAEQLLMNGQDDDMLEPLAHAEQPFESAGANPGGTSDVWSARDYPLGAARLLFRFGPVQPTHLRAAVRCHRHAGYLRDFPNIGNGVPERIASWGHPEMHFDSAGHMVLIAWPHLPVPRVVMSMNEPTFMVYLHMRLPSSDSQAVADFMNIVLSSPILDATRDYLLNTIGGLIRYSHLEYDDPPRNAQGLIIPVGLRCDPASFGLPHESYYYLPRRGHIDHPRILNDPSPTRLRETMTELDEALQTVIVGGIGGSSAHGVHSPLQLASGELMTHMVSRLLHARHYVDRVFQRRFGGIRFTFGSRYSETDQAKLQRLRHRFVVDFPPTVMPRPPDDDDPDGKDGGEGHGGAARQPSTGRTHTPRSNRVAGQKLITSSQSNLCKERAGDKSLARNQTRVVSGAVHKLLQSTQSGTAEQSFANPITWSKDSEGDIPLVDHSRYHNDAMLPEVEPLFGNPLYAWEDAKLQPAVLCRQHFAFLSASKILLADEEARDHVKANINDWYRVASGGDAVPPPIQSLVFSIRDDVTDWRSDSATVRSHASLYRLPRTHPHGYEDLRPSVCRRRRRDHSYRDASVAMRFNTEKSNRDDDAWEIFHTVVKSPLDGMSQEEMFAFLNDSSRSDPRGVGHKEVNPHVSRLRRNNARSEAAYKRHHPQITRRQPNERTRKYRIQSGKKKLHMVHRARKAKQKQEAYDKKHNKIKGDGMNDIILDSGASITMFRHVNWPDVVSCTAHVESVRMGNSEQEQHWIDSTHKLVFDSGVVALVVPDLGSNIVSEGDLTRLGWDIHRYASGDCLISEPNSDGTDYIVSLAKRTGDNMWLLQDLEVLRYRRSTRLEMERTGTYSQPSTASKFQQQLKRRTLASKSGGDSAPMSGDLKGDTFSDNGSQYDLAPSDTSDRCLPRTPSKWLKEAVDKDEREEYCRGKLIHLLRNNTLKGRYELHRPLALRRDKKTNPLQALHDRCGHLTKESIKQMLDHNAVIGIGVKWKDIKMYTINCRECRLATMTRLPSQQSSRDTSTLEPFEEVNMDIVGQFRVMSRSGGTYVLLFVDTASFWIAIYECKKKSEVLDLLQGFVQEHVQATQHVLKTLVGDFDPNFTDQTVLAWCYRNHIKARFSAPYHHQGNGRAERAVRKVLDLARTLMIAAGSPPKSYTFIYLQMAVWYLNRRPLERLQWKTPYEMVHGRKPDMSKCVPADAIGYALIYDEEDKREKMDPKAVEVSLAGYPEDVEGYYVRFPNGRVMIRRDVIFDEGERPSRLTSRYLGNDINEDELRAYSATSEKALLEDFSGNLDGKETGEDEPANKQRSSMAAQPAILSHELYGLHPNFAPLLEEALLAENPYGLPSPAPVARSKSPKKKEVAPEVPHTYGTRTATGTPRKQRAMLLQQLAAEPILPPTPRSLREALDERNEHRREWLQATYDEVNAMFDRGVFVRVPDEMMTREQKRRAFDSKFVFRIKKNPEGLKFKVRLVARGFTMIAGVDYDSTFAPTIEFSVILIVLHIAATLGYIISGIDVGNAYLEALADRDNLVMKLPVDFACFGLHGNFEHRKTVEEVYVRLAHNLYGTPQGAMLWYRLLCKVLMDGGFTRLESEPCCFTNLKSNSTVGIIILCVYVDDVLIVAEKPEGMVWFKTWIATRFTKISDLGNMPKYLGMEVRRLENNIGIELSQKAYIEEVAKEFKVTRKYASPLPVDIDRFLDLPPDGTEPLLKILGKLRFLADRTRPDISFACSFLARFAIAPNIEHRKLAIRVVGYLLDSIEETMVVGSCKGEIKLSASADASFIRGGESKGQIGIALYLSEDSAAVHSKSQKDKCVSISSFHAEVNALVEVIKFILWARHLLKELGFEQRGPTFIEQDNTGVIDAVSKMGNDTRTRYLINKLNFAREQSNEGTIAVTYTNTHANTTDGSTKALARIQQEIYRVGQLQGKMAAKELKKNQEQKAAAAARMEVAVHLTRHHLMRGDMKTADTNPFGKMQFLNPVVRPDVVHSLAVEKRFARIVHEEAEHAFPIESKGLVAVDTMMHNPHQQDNFPVAVGQLLLSTTAQSNASTVGACKGNDYQADTEGVCADDSGSLSTT